MTYVLLSNTLVLFLAAIGNSIKQVNIMFSKLGRQCMFYLSEFEILISNERPLYLFDHDILPVALYGCEICGFGYTQVIKN